MSTLSGRSKAQALPYAIQRWQENQFERCLRWYGNSGYSITLSSFLSIDKEINITESHNCAQPTCRSRSSASYYYYYLLSTQKAVGHVLLPSAFVDGCALLPDWPARVSTDGDVANFFLSFFSQKEKEIPRSEEEEEVWWTWDLEQYHDDRQESRILGTAARRKPETTTIGRERRMKRERTNKEKGRKKKKTKVALRFLVGMRRERGVRSFGGSFSSFATLSLSLSVSPYRRPQKSPCRYANAPAGVAPALLIAPYSSFGSHACPYSVWCSKFAFNDTSGGTSKEETPWVSSKAKWRDEGKKRTQQQQQDNLLLCNVCV